MASVPPKPRRPHASRSRGPAGSPGGARSVVGFFAGGGRLEGAPGDRPAGTPAYPGRIAREEGGGVRGGRAPPPRARAPAEASVAAVSPTTEAPVATSAA